MTGRLLFACPNVVVIQYSCSSQKLTRPDAKLAEVLKAGNTASTRQLDYPFIQRVCVPSFIHQRDRFTDLANALAMREDSGHEIAGSGFLHEIGSAVHRGAQNGGVIEQGRAAILFANKNDDPERLIEAAVWWIKQHELDNFEKAQKSMQ